MKLSVGILVGVIALQGVWPFYTLACSCLTVPSPHAATESVDVVFVGKVSNVEVIPADGWLYGSWKQLYGAENLYEHETLRVTLEVGTAIKGAEQSPVVVETAASTEICGVLFQLDKEYLVYGYNGPAGTITTDMCTRTATAENAADDIQALVSKEITPICEGWTCIND